MNIKANQRSERTKRILFGESWLGSFGRIIVLFVILTFPFFYSFNPTFVIGTSMEPTYKNGDLVVVTRARGEYIPKRYDIVVVQLDDEKWIKRVMGLPGDKVRFDLHGLLINDTIAYDFIVNDDFVINGSFIETIVPVGYVWVIGDNRDNTEFGLFHTSDILGKVVY